MKKVENFYKESLFSFQNPTCICRVDTINETPTDVKRIFKVIKDDTKLIQFAFQPSKGVVRINQKTGAVEEDNVLSRLISIDSSSINDFSRFFERNGFLFPLDNSMTQIDDNTLIKIISNLRTTVNLMSQVSEMARKDYKKMLVASLHLLTAAPLQLKVGSKEYVVSGNKTLLQILKKGREHKVNPATKNYNKDWEFEVYDSIYGTTKVHIDEYRHYTTDADINEFDHDVFYSYVNYTDAPKQERILIEILYHLHKEYGDFTNVTPDEIEFLNPWKVNWKLLDDDRFKQAILEMAKYAVSEEINGNLQGIYPEYDSISMEPRWRVDGLLSALYFSLFYMKPDVELMRLCANPKCGNYFKISRTSSKKKYCCPECANRANQNRYRARIKGLD